MSTPKKNEEFKNSFLRVFLDEEAQFASTFQKFGGLYPSNS